MITLYRGHPIFYENGKFFYYDNKKPTAGTERPCGHCGKGRTKEGHDGCLGALKGVMNACCGHGCDNEAYVQFLDKNILEGEKAIIYQQHNRKQ